MGKTKTYRIRGHALRIAIGIVLTILLLGGVAYADSQLTYAQVNGQTLSASNPTITVSPGASLTGTINVDLKDSCSSCAIYSVGINSWDRSYYANLGGISGDNQWHTKQLSFSFTAPSSSGTYYIAIGYGACYAAADVVYGCYGLSDPRRGQPGGGDDIWDTANWESMMPANQPSGAWRAIKIIVQNQFDFSISVSPNSGSVVAGNALSPAGTVTLSLLSGSTQPVALTLTGLPSTVGTHGLEGLPGDTCSPTCSKSFGIGTYATAPPGTYSLTITGTGGGKTYSTAYVLIVTQPPQQTGTINVNTNLASASFMISGTASYSGSGISWSTTNAPAGTYTITYGAVTGYNTPPSETKTLAAGGSITFSGTYVQTQTTGSIAVSSTPSGASIYLDGSYQSTTPYTITNVPAGSHTVTLKLNGYQDWSTTVNAVAGQTSTVSASLTAQITITPIIASKKEAEKLAEIAKKQAEYFGLISTSFKNRMDLSQYTEEMTSEWKSVGEALMPKPEAIPLKIILKIFKADEVKTMGDLSKVIIVPFKSLSETTFWSEFWMKPELRQRVLVITDKLDNLESLYLKESEYWNKISLGEGNKQTVDDLLRTLRKEKDAIEELKTALNSQMPAILEEFKGGGFKPLSIASEGVAEGATREYEFEIPEKPDFIDLQIKQTPSPEDYFWITRPKYKMELTVKRVGLYGEEDFVKYTEGTIIRMLPPETNVALGGLPTPLKAKLKVNYEDLGNDNLIIITFWGVDEGYKNANVDITLKFSTKEKTYGAIYEFQARGLEDFWKNFNSYLYYSKSVTERTISQLED